jgi:hypothetical protein
MKSRSLIGFIAAIFFLASCSKSPTNTIKTTTTTTTTTTTPAVIPPSPVPITTPPLAGTVDKTDTLKVIAYNVLSYGDGCQGSTTTLNGYFKTIIQYAQPDLMSCEKMTAFPVTSSLPTNLADNITDSVLNTVFPGRYAYATPTDVSGGSNMSVLFYNKQKLTYVKTENLVAYITDFDLYKLYYNDPNIAITHDTTFLYVVVNHTQSGSPSTTRDMQVENEMKSLRAKFAYFPNLINMGDFNTANSYEAGYQSIITSTDTSTVMYDPTFYPDKTEKYPAEWEDSAPNYAANLTTTTRALATIPNSCGTGGGAKSWYDHLFISPWLVRGTNYLQYVPNSYQTIGNDGHRLDVNINSTTPQVNTSAPAAVINALYQFSDKYPVSVKLLVKANRNQYSIPDPAERK